MGKLMTIPKNSKHFEPYLSGLCSTLNGYYADNGGRAKIVDGKIIFEQSWEPSETSEGHYVRVEISIDTVQVRN